MTYTAGQVEDLLQVPGGQNFLPHHAPLEARGIGLHEVQDALSIGLLEPLLGPGTAFRGIRRVLREEVTDMGSGRGECGVEARRNHHLNHGLLRRQAPALTGPEGGRQQRRPLAVQVNGALVHVPNNAVPPLRVRKEVGESGQSNWEHKKALYSGLKTD